ncbi:MAG: hypothetical protein H6988_11625 [Pseudomonadales bacterium]|nr:hypothetical protein [Pseudomonadales bacterium]
MSESSIPHPASPDTSTVMDRLFDCAALIEAAAQMIEQIEQDGDIRNDEVEVGGRLNYVRRVLRQAHNAVVDRVEDLDRLQLKQAA